MIDYTEQRKTLEAIEEEQEQDLFTTIQLIFYLNPLIGRRNPKVSRIWIVKKPCFDLMDFHDEKFFTIKEKEDELITIPSKRAMDTQFGICSNCHEFILSAMGCDCWKEEAYRDSEPWEFDEDGY